MRLQLLFGPRILWLLFFISLFFFQGQRLSAQSRPLGSWNILNAKLTINNHWSVWAEGQVRSVKFYDDFNYFEAKGAVNYNFTKTVSVTAGIGRYETYSSGGNFEEPLVTGETRTWFQMNLEQKLSRVILEHRYRVEQRHLTTGYKNRFRYRLLATVPINHPEMIPGTFYGYLGDEIFFTSKEPYYERNRFFTGLGYKFSPLFALQSGYMRQFDYKIDSQQSRDFLQVAVLLNFKLQEHHEPGVPKTSDD